MIGWDPWNKKRVIYLSCIEGKGGLKWSAQNATLFVDYYEISFNRADRYKQPSNLIVCIWFKYLILN